MTRPRTGMVINTGVANLYREPAFASEVISQAFLGESPEVIDQDGKWFKIRQWDGYEGWVYYFYLAKAPEGAPEADRITVTATVAEIRADRSADSSVLRDAVYGSQLSLLDRVDGWNQVSLPDGKLGWIADQPPSPSGSIREQMVTIAKQFLGAPYMWGGKSIRGFDCSGFVQTIFKGVGIDLPRDAHLQDRFDDLPTVEPSDAEAGDLLFFSERENRITHVAMSIGRETFIHASGWVKIETLNSAAENFNHLLNGMFTAGKNVTKLIDATA